MRIIVSTLLSASGIPSTFQDVSFVVLVIYGVCVVLVIGGIMFAKSALKLRTQVLRKHSEDMGKLDDWERAIKYAYSGSETEILTALDIFWALSNPGTYAEIQPIVAIFINHSNREIAVRAHRIAERQQSFLTSPVPPEAGGGGGVSRS